MLPQRRKTAEEIAKLREGLGIPGAAPAEAEEAGPEAPVSDPVPAPPASPPAAEAAPHPRSDVPGVRSGPPLAHATDLSAPARERIRHPVRDTVPMAAAAAGEAPPPAAPRQPRAVRSLRKSEQGIIEPRPLDPEVSVVRVEGPALPQRRRSERELMELRRVQSVPPDQSISHLQQLAARWYWVGLAYLLPLLGVLCAYLAYWLPDVPAPDFPTIAMAEFSRQPWLGTLGFWLLASTCTIGLLMAGWFAWKKPRSRHHAGFITILGVLVLVFGIIHQFTPDYGP